MRQQKWIFCLGLMALAAWLMSFSSACAAPQQAANEKAAEDHVKRGNALRVAARDDQAGNAWSTAASMPTTRFGLAAATANGKIYAIGGFSGFHGQGTKAVNTVEVYDPVTNAWSTALSMPKVRLSLAAVTVNEKIYVIGEDYGSGKLDVFDPATNSWSTAAPMPTARLMFAAATVNGKIYAIGGCSGFDPVNTVEIYDPATNSWSTGAPMPSARCSLAVASVNGKIYAIGGAPGIPLPVKRETYAIGGGLEATVEVYDAATNSWSAAAPMPMARQHLAAVTVKGEIYAIGGEAAGPPLKVKGKIYTTMGAAVNTVGVYDPATNTWTKAAHMPSARASFAAATVNDTLYAIGGANGRIYLNTVEALPVSGADPNARASYGRTAGTASELTLQLLEAGGWQALSPTVAPRVSVSHFFLVAGRKSMR